MATDVKAFEEIQNGSSPASDNSSHSPFEFRESDIVSSKYPGTRRSSGASSTSSRRNSGKALANAAEKFTKAQTELDAYKSQHAEAIREKEKLEEENEYLRQTILTQALENASIDLKREHMQLKQTLESYQSKIDQMREISLLTAKVVDR